jgi:16S rRNA (guanine966-N2)-methyltransferase
MRIITGSLKGRVVPFDNLRFGNAATTSGRMKEAAFSMLGANLSGLSFLDLFACSGQIGLEAFSRGAQLVMNELDDRRYRFITTLIENWNLEGIQTFCDHAEKLLVSFSTEGRKFDIIFLDPPYHKKIGNTPFVEHIFSRLEESGVLSPGGTVMVQHAHTVTMPDLTPRLARVTHKRFRDTLLSAYQAIKEV